MSPENLKNKPQIEQFFKRIPPNDWAMAAHPANVDIVKRFSMKELETIGFKDMLTGDVSSGILLRRRLWHWAVESKATFYHKSPGAR
jgi:hypothetical protein